MENRLAIAFVGVDYLMIVQMHDLVGSWLDMDRCLAIIWDSGAEQVGIDHAHRKVCVDENVIRGRRMLVQYGKSSRGCEYLALSILRLYFLLISANHVHMPQAS